MNKKKDNNLSLFNTLMRSSILRRQVETHVEIKLDPPRQIDFLHAAMCQVGMPRRSQKKRSFERSNGFTSILLEAGKLYQLGKFVEMPLPYGTRPRLVMVHLSTEAVRTRNREIEIGDSIRDFMKTLGIDTGGHEYGRFKRQMEALAACRMTLGMSTPNRDITINTQPIKRFEAWLHPTGQQRIMWPGVLELSQDFYETLVNHAVPLDKRALGALKHSALCLDIYSWLAHRLHRIQGRVGTKLSWGNLRNQFGQEYKNPKDFKREFKNSLHQVMSVYPDAKIESTYGGIMLHSSQPPVRKTQILTLG